MATATVNTMTELRALAAPTEVSDRAVMLGYHSLNDGGEGGFVGDPSSTEDDNGGTIIKPDSVASDAPGRWNRISTPGLLNVRWFGATGDGSTDDLVAFNNARATSLALADSLGLYRGQRIYVPAGTYVLSDSFHVSQSLILEGEGTSSRYSPTQLKFPVGKDGIVVDPPLGGGVYGQGAIIRGLGIYGTIPTTWSATQAHIVGDVRSQTNFIYSFWGSSFQCVVAGTTGGSEPTWPTGRPCTVGGSALGGTGLVRVSNVVTVTKPNHGYSPGNLVYLMEGEANFAAGAKTIATVPNANHFTYNEVGANATAVNTHNFGPCVVDGSVTWAAVPSHGIHTYFNAQIEFCSIFNFQGHGIYMYGMSADVPTTSANAMMVRSCFIEDCTGNGLDIYGTDGNAGLFMNIIVSSCYGWGSYDESDTGNCYINLILEGNGADGWLPDTAYALNAIELPGFSILQPYTGFYYTATTGGTSDSTPPAWPTNIGDTVDDGSVIWTCTARYSGGGSFANINNALNGSQYISIYEEGGENGQLTFRPAVVIGSPLGAGYSNSTGLNFSAVSTPFRVVSSRETQRIDFTAGAPLNPGQPYAFGIFRGDAQDGAGFNMVNGGGNWGLIDVGSGAYPFLFTDDLSAYGPGNFIFSSKGYYLRPGYDIRRFSSLTIPDASVGSVGDVCWALSGGISGNALGWRCVVAAPGAVWVPFWPAGSRTGYFGENASTVGDPAVINSGQSQAYWNDSGNAGSMVAYTLPVVVTKDGFKVTAYVRTAFGIRLNAPTGESIWLGDTQSSAGGYIESSDPGSTVVLEAIGSTTVDLWFATAITGIWTAA